MGGLLSFLSPALTTATQAAGAQSQGDMDAQARQQAQTMQLIALARQKALDEQNATEGTARANYYNAMAQQRQLPPPYTLAPGATRFGGNNAKVAVGGPLTMSPYQQEELKDREADLAARRSEIAGVTQTTGLDGKPLVTGWTRGGGTVRLGQAVPKGGASGQGAQTSLFDMLRTHDAMAADENDPSFSVGFAQQQKEGAAYGISHAQTAGQAPGLLNLVVGALTPLTGGLDERTANYIRKKRFFGEDASQALKGRTNEERVIRDVATQGLDYSNDKMPSIRSNLQARRENIIAMGALANPQQFQLLSHANQARIAQWMTGVSPEDRASIIPAEAVDNTTSAPAPSSGLPSITGDQYQRLLQGGYTDAEIRQKYKAP